MLSLAFISMSSTSVADVPSTFIVNEEEVPPDNFTLDKRSFWLLALKILND